MLPARSFVLVAEGDTYVRDSLIGAFRSSAIDARGCATGDEALEFVERGCLLGLVAAASLPLRPVLMPRIRDGYDLTSRAAVQRPDLPLVVLAANTVVPVDALPGGCIVFCGDPEPELVVSAIRAVFTMSARGRLRAHLSPGPIVFASGERLHGLA